MMSKVGMNCFVNWKSVRIELNYPYLKPGHTRTSSPEREKSISKAADWEDFLEDVNIGYMNIWIQN